MDGEETPETCRQPLNRAFLLEDPELSDSSRANEHLIGRGAGADHFATQESTRDRAA